MNISTPFNQTQLLPTRWGHMVALTCDPFQTGSLALYGEWSAEECAKMCEFIGPGDVVLDVGANIGTLTVAFAKRVGIGGRVFSFEPQRIPHMLLCANIALTHTLIQASAHNVAVGDSNKTTEVPVIDFNQPFNVGGVRLDDSRYDAAVRLPKEPVPQITIDSLELSRVDLIKIDVETMEAKVLAGARETIARCRPVIFAEAIFDGAGEHENANLAAMLETFKEHQYECRFLKTMLFDPNNARFCPDKIFPDGDRNVVAIPNERFRPIWFSELPVAAV